MANGHGGARSGAGRKSTAVVKARKELAALAGEHGEMALNVLVSIAANDEETGATRVSAAIAILDRAYGKPTQAVKHEGELEVREITRRFVDVSSHATTAGRQLTH